MAASSDFELVITRRLRAPRSLVWKAWSDPNHLKEWWCPRPWTTQVLGFDFVPGGTFHTLMTGPEGDTSDNPGAFLDIVPGARIVWTSMLVGGWRPAVDPWMPMTAFITMEDAGDDTHYVARVLHRDKTGRDQHEQMGFFDGWETCITQLEEFTALLR